MSFGGSPSCPVCGKAVYHMEQVIGPGRKVCLRIRKKTQEVVEDPEKIQNEAVGCSYDRGLQHRYTTKRVSNANNVKRGLIRVQWWNMT